MSITQSLGPGGPALACEVTYRDILQLGYLTSELSAYYNAFSYPPNPAEAPRHVSVEAGFAGFLCMKEAYALASKETGPAALVRDAAENFRKEHLSHIADPLNSRSNIPKRPIWSLRARLLPPRVGPAEKRIFEILGQETPIVEDGCFERGPS